MADRNELDDAATQALLAAGKSAAKRAAFDLLSSDEERAAKQNEEKRAGKQRRWKLIAGAVLVAFVIIGVIGMLVSYWPWFLLAGVLGLAGLFGWWRIKSRLAARKGKEPERAVAAREPEAPRVRAEAPRRDAEATQRAAEARERAAEARERDARALAEARASDEQAVEDELAALKARVKRTPPRE